jgi:hypothetical protein
LISAAKETAQGRSLHPGPIMGLSDVPQAGDLFQVGGHEKAAGELVAERKLQHQESRAQPPRQRWRNCSAGCSRVRNASCA